jgi:hypothetical protein
MIKQSPHAIPGCRNLIITTSADRILFLFSRGCCLFIDLDERKKVQGSKVVGICSTARLINRQVYFVPLLHILSLARALLLFVP